MIVELTADKTTLLQYWALIHFDALVKIEKLFQLVWIDMYVIKYVVLDQLGELLDGGVQV